MIFSYILSLFLFPRLINNTPYKFDDICISTDRIRDSFTFPSTAMTRKAERH